MQATVIQIQHTVITSLLGLFVLVLVTATSVVVVLKESQVTETCDSFSTYSQALAAYQKGNTRLDHNSNGRPCEKLYKVNIIL